MLEPAQVLATLQLKELRWVQADWASSVMASPGLAAEARDGANDDWGRHRAHPLWDP